MLLLEVQFTRGEMHRSEAYSWPYSTFPPPAEQPHAPSQSISPTLGVATSQTFIITDEHSLFFLKIFWLYRTACRILVL